jgi:hypothetical protein
MNTDTYLDTPIFSFPPTHPPVDANRWRLANGARRYYDNSTRMENLVLGRMHQALDCAPDQETFDEIEATAIEIQNLADEYYKSAMILELFAIHWVDTSRLVASWLQPWLDDGCACTPVNDIACLHCQAIHVMKEEL